MANIKIETREQEQVMVAYQATCKKPFYMPFESGRIDTPSLTVWFRTTVDEGVRISSKACKDFPRINATYYPKTGLISCSHTTDKAQYIISLVVGTMLYGLYEKKEVVTKAHRTLGSPYLHGSQGKTRKGKSSLPWVGTKDISPERVRDTKAFTRPEEQVAVKGHIRHLKDGREVFVRAYIRYRDQKERSVGNTYQI